jgi:hypothetical protein
MSLPARYQHKQPLGAPVRRAAAKPGKLVVYSRSTKRLPGLRRSPILESGGRSRGGLLLRWEAELFENWRQS